MPYRIYSKKNILQKAIEYRMSHRSKRGSIPSAVALFFSFGYRSFAVIYKPSYFTGHDHLEFYARSEGFFGYTDTGYKSIFVPAYSDGIYSFKEIKENMIELLKKEAGLDLADENQAPVQLSLF